MNIRAETFLVPAGAVEAGARPARLAPVWMSPIAEQVTAVFFDEAAEPGMLPPNARLSTFIDGAKLTRPLIASRLDLASGGRRHVLLLNHGVETLEGKRIDLAQGSRVLAAMDPDWLQTPRVDGATLAAGLTDKGRRRLLRLLLTTGASLFRYGEGSVLGEALGFLLDLMGAPPLEPASWCAMGGTDRLISYRIGSGWSQIAQEDLVALCPDRIARIAGFGLHVETTAQGAVLHVHAPHLPQAAAALIGIGETTLVLRAPTPQMAAQPLVPWLARRSEPARAWIEARLARAAINDAQAVVLHRELRHDAAPPVLEVRHLSRTPQGLLVSLDVADAHDRLAALRVEHGSAWRDMSLPEDAIALSGKARLCAFLPIADVAEDAPCRIRFAFRSGRIQTVYEGVPPAFTGAVPQGLGAGRDAASSLAAARLSLPRRTPPQRIEAIGAQPRRPTLSLLVRLSPDADILRARAAMLRRERGLGATELLYYGPVSERLPALHSALRDIHAVFGLGCRLLALAADADETEALRAGLAAAGADAVLVQGAAILPSEAGWLAAWTRALRGSGPRIMGGTILGPDGSIRDAGALRPEADPDTPTASKPHHCGLSARDLGRTHRRRTDLVTVDCVGLNRAAIDRFLAGDAHYPTAGVLLGETIAAIGAHGTATRTLLRHRFVQYTDHAARDPFEDKVDAHALARRLDRLGETR